MNAKTALQTDIVCSTDIPAVRFAVMENRLPISRMKIERCRMETRIYRVVGQCFDVCENEPPLLKNIRRIFTCEKAAIHTAQSLAEEECEERNRLLAEKGCFEVVNDGEAEIHIRWYEEKEHAPDSDFDVVTVYSIYSAEQREAPSPMNEVSADWYSYRDFSICPNRTNDTFIVCRDNGIYGFKPTLEGAFQVVDEWILKQKEDSKSIRDIYKKYGAIVFMMSMSLLMGAGIQSVYKSSIENTAAKLSAMYPKKTDEAHYQSYLCACELSKFSPYELLEFVQTDAELLGITVHPGVRVEIRSKSDNRLIRKLLLPANTYRGMLNQFEERLKTKLEKHSAAKGYVSGTRCDDIVREVLYEMKLEEQEEVCDRTILI